MIFDEYLDFLAPDEIRIRGHRIGIEDLLYEYVYNEMTPAELAARFPSLSLEEIHAVLLYYYRNQAAMNSYLSDWLAFGEQMRTQQAADPAPVILTLRRVREQRAVYNTDSRDNLPGR